MLKAHQILSQEHHDKFETNAHDGTRYKEPLAGTFELSQIVLVRTTELQKGSPVQIDAHLPVTSKTGFLCRTRVVSLELDHRVS